MVGLTGEWFGLRSEHWLNMDTQTAIPCPFVSVVVPTFNRADSLGNTIESLVNQDYDNSRYEIIVVDNNCSDHTRSIIDHWCNRSVVRILYLFEGRQGVHFARNAAYKHAKGEVLYYTDDDMIADRQLINEIVKPFAYDPKVAVVTGLVLPKWEQDPPEWVSVFCKNHLLSLQIRPEVLIISPTDCGVYSCHQAIRRDVFAEAGGFNPENTAGVWIGDGETGLNLKIGDLGYWFAFTRAAVTYHTIPAHRMTQKYLNMRLSNQGNCDSYTDFRRSHFTTADLSRQIFRHGLALGNQGIRMLIKGLMNRSSWRLNRAHMAYYASRICYDARLMTDEKWRSMATRDGWLE